MRSAVELGTGIRQEVELFGPPGSRLFGSRLLPSAGAQAGVVMCSPLHAELPKNYRREVLLSRLLATRGLAVQRFHYRGAGHSDGDSSKLTLGSMCRDARAAAHHLAEETGIARLALMGTRLGGLIAAATTLDWLEGVPLVMWEPVVDIGSYFGEAFRARLMSELKRGHGTDASSDSLLEQLEREGSVDVLGYQLERPLYQSAEGRTLASALEGRSQPALLVQLGAGDHLRPDYSEVAQRLSAQGCPMTTAVVDLQVAWWLQSEVWRKDAQMNEETRLIDLTADWLVETVSA